MTGGAYGTGQRMSLEHTRAIIDAIHGGHLDEVETIEDPVFGVAVPRSVPGVPSDVLVPRDTWEDEHAYDVTARKLAALFNSNFEQYRKGSSEAIISAGPRL
jgi:phosphoenolpyruvate carboxykinase (ATP)